MKVILDLANNHQGDIEHGMKVITDHALAIADFNAEKILKFQFRELSSFIHPAATKENCSYLERFTSTSLTWDEFSQLATHAKDCGFKTACTPFDEASVDKITEIGFDYIKIASCSACDWPLLEKAIDANLPMIVSTGGLQLNEIDNVVSFLTHRAASFSLMHCISLYPTNSSDCHLSNISLLKGRYPGTEIGWSTHEDPENTSLVGIAVSLGATLLERHIGIRTDKYSLNAYSSTPAQISTWLHSLEDHLNSIRHPDYTDLVQRQKQALMSLSRGTYAARDISKGEEISHSDVFFAFPILDDAFPSGDWKESSTALKYIKKGGALTRDNCRLPADSKGMAIKTSIHEIKALLSVAGIHLNSEFEVEYSHHYGMESFREVGCAIINCINRSYCKKLLVMLPGQRHPLHHHPLKEETFQLLYGDLRLTLDGQERNLQPGCTCLVLPGVWHEFSSQGGAVIEEVSSTHYDNDSIYKDVRIRSSKRSDRKTIVDHWGRYQFQ